MSYWKLSERTQLFSSSSCTKLYDIDIDEISEFLFRKHNIFTKHGERSAYLFAHADENDIMATRFTKNGGFTFHEGLFLYYEYQAWFNLKFTGKNYFVIFFHVKIKVSCPRAELPCRRLVHSVLFKYILNYTWSKWAIVILIINGKITWLNFAWF